MHHPQSRILINNIRGLIWAWYISPDNRWHRVVSLASGPSLETPVCLVRAVKYGREEVS